MSSIPSIITLEAGLSCRTGEVSGFAFFRPGLPGLLIHFSFDRLLSSLFSSSTTASSLVDSFSRLLVLLLLRLLLGGLSSLDRWTSPSTRSCLTLGCCGSSLLLVASRATSPLASRRLFPICCLSFSSTSFAASASWSRCGPLDPFRRWTSARRSGGLLALGVEHSASSDREPRSRGPWDVASTCPPDPPDCLKATGRCTWPAWWPLADCALLDRFLRLESSWSDWHRLGLDGRATPPRGSPPLCLPGSGSAPSSLTWEVSRDCVETASILRGAGLLISVCRTCHTSGGTYR